MTLRLSLALALGLATQAAAVELDNMSDNERNTFRAEIRAYLLENPEVLMEAIDVLEQRERAAAAEADIAMAREHADTLFNDGYSFVGGNPDGDITIVEFLDYRCGYCKRAFPEVSRLVSGDGNIRYIVKELPVLGEQSVMASRFAIATQITAGDDAYELVHNTLMEFRGDISMQSLTRLSDTLGLDTAAITAAMDSPEVNVVITANNALAQQLKISGTPTFVVQDQMLRGYVPLAQMEQIVATLRDNG